MNNIDPKEREWLLREKYFGIDSGAFRADLLRLEKGEPVAYVIGFSKFLDCYIDLSYRPLIPRPETEYWVEKAMNEIEKTHGKDAELRFLDIFSGSGCIGIALLKRFPNAAVDFGEINITMIQQIKKNLDLNMIEANRYRLYQSDVFESIPEGKYNAIFANPPYISVVDKEARVQDSVLRYEPHGALFADEEGMALIVRTLSRAHEFLKQNGVLYIEFDDIQKDRIQEQAEKMNLAHEFFTDQFGLIRYGVFSGMK